VNRENPFVSNRGIAAHHDFLVSHLSQRIEQLHLFDYSEVVLRLGPQRTAAGKTSSRARKNWRGGETS
jgi:hypothetical protein